MTPTFDILRGIVSPSLRKKLVILLNNYKSRKSGIRLLNPSALLKREGDLEFSNGFILPFNERNKEKIINLCAFILANDVCFVDQSKELLPIYSTCWKFYKDFPYPYIATPSGIKFELDFDILIMAETFLYDTHFIDFDLTGKEILEAGGYIGDTALYFAEKGAIVHSFEPNPANNFIFFKNLSLNPALSKRITLHYCALGLDGRFNIPSDFSGRSSIYDKTNKSFSVKSKSLKSVLNYCNIAKPDILHLDVKGAEWDILDQDEISLFKRVRIEYNSRIINDSQTIDSALQRLIGHGFKTRVFKHNPLKFSLADHGTIDAIKEDYEI